MVCLTCVFSTVKKGKKWHYARGELLSDEEFNALALEDSTLSDVEDSSLDGCGIPPGFDVPEHGEEMEDERGEEMEDERGEEHGEDMEDERGEEHGEEMEDERGEEHGEEMEDERGEEHGEEMEDEHGAELSEEMEDERGEEHGEEMEDEHGEELSEEHGANFHLRQMGSVTFGIRSRTRSGQPKTRSGQKSWGFVHNLC